MKEHQQSINKHNPREKADLQKKPRQRLQKRKKSAKNKTPVNRRPDWEEDETTQCVKESNGTKLQLRGSYKGPGGSRAKKEAGWKEVTSE